jgi:aspartyl-tRNA(Asn)/glutamyl-tRNA(Gln) amidotransferase subunit C
VSISESDVRHVAALARVGLDEARIPALVQELNGILEHMDVLQRVEIPDGADQRDTRQMPLRDDVAAPVVLAADRESFAPAMRDGFFLVPRLSTHSAAGVSDVAVTEDE